MSAAPLPETVTVVTVELPEPAVRYTDERDMSEVARWGGTPGVPYEFETLSVWSSQRAGGEVEVSELRVGLDDAETLALRILAAVHHERLALQRQADADLLASARGNGATHDWDTSESAGFPGCRRCRTKAMVRQIEHGAVPACSPDVRCPLGWHEIASPLGSDRATDGECIFCETVYPATAEAGVGR